MSSSSGPSRSATQMALDIIKTRGFRTLYLGAHLHILRDGFGTAMYFAGYELMKHSLTRPGETSGPLIHILAGGTAGTSCWLVLFPIDLVKSVIQREALKESPKYKNAREFIKSAWMRGGIRRFYAGIGPQLVRSFPVHALNFLVYEHVLNLCTS